MVNNNRPIIFNLLVVENYAHKLALTNYLQLSCKVAINGLGLDVVLAVQQSLVHNKNINVLLVAIALLQCAHLRY